MRKKRGVITIAVEETKRPKKMCGNTFDNSEETDIITNVNQ